MTKEAGSGQTAYVFDLQIMPTQAYRKLTKFPWQGAEKYSEKANRHCSEKPALIEGVNELPWNRREHPSLQFIHTFIDRRYSAVYLLGAFFRSLSGGSFALSNFQHTLTPDWRFKIFSV
jgi:hypothetical protein